MLEAPAISATPVLRTTRCQTRQLEALGNPNRGRT